MKSKEVNFTILPLVSPSYERDEIDLAQIRRYAYNSFDEFPKEDRAVAWLALLHVYPMNPREWPKVSSDINEKYWDFVSSCQLENWHRLNYPCQLVNTVLDCPNKNLMGTIHGDIVRTGKSIFCFKPAPIPLKEGEKVFPSDEPMYEFAEHARRLERVLYIFSTLNPGLSYMQGYNEILCPLYYVLYEAISLFHNDWDLVEALTFKCFQVLMSESRLNEFYTTADKSSIILHRLNDFTTLIKKHLPNVYSVLERFDIHPLLYCYRWFNLLFSQEHDFSTLLLIWDDLFGHFDELMDFAFYIGLGHIKEFEGQITTLNDYSKILSILQNLNDINIKNVLNTANKFWEADHSISPLEKFRNLFF